MIKIEAELKKLFTPNKTSCCQVAPCIISSPVITEMHCMGCGGSHAVYACDLPTAILAWNKSHSEEATFEEMEDAISALKNKDSEESYIYLGPKMIERVKAETFPWSKQLLWVAAKAGDWCAFTRIGDRAPQCEEFYVDQKDLDGGRDPMGLCLLGLKRTTIVYEREGFLFESKDGYEIEGEVP